MLTISSVSRVRYVDRGSESEKTFTSSTIKSFAGIIIESRRKTTKQEKIRRSKQPLDE